MSVWDDRILEQLSDEGPQTPSDIADLEYIHRSRSNVNQRLKKLEKHGLVENIGNGVYQLTDEGRLYLIGGYNAQTGELTVDEEGEGAYHKDRVKMKLRKIRDEYLL